ncbi:MAG: hypothetical protein K5792_08220 [Butyrivibrio sp.]|nr:hypothetical protein [Butyrivibrio sp.]
MAVERYMEAFDAFEKCFKNKNVEVKHRSMKKMETGTNRDISFYYNDKYICGVYVAKEKYKFYLDDNSWRESTKGQASDIKEDGWYNIFFEDLSDCVEDVKNYFSKYNNSQVD